MKKLISISIIVLSIFLLPATGNTILQYLQKKESHKNCNQFNNSKLVTTYTKGTFDKSTILYENNFDSFNNGDYLAIVDSQNWTTWNDNPGSAEDAFVVNTIAETNPNSVLVENSSDLVFPCGNLTSGSYTIEFDMYIPTGKAGYFNLQHIFASEWAIETYFHTSGDAKIIAGGLEITDINFSHNTWIKILIEIDIDNDIANMFWDNNEVISFQWSLKPDGTSGTNQLSCLNMFVGAEGNDIATYCFDNFKFSETSTALIPPTISVNEDELSVLITDGQSENESFIISNLGEQDLIFEAYPVYEVGEVSGSTTAQMAYCSDYESNLGSTHATTRKNAVFFGPSILQNYIGTEITSIEFFIGDEVPEFMVKAWGPSELTVPGPGDEIYSAPFVPTVNAWNIVELTEPIIIDGTPIYIGVSYFQAADTYCFGLDAGPRIPNINWSSTGPGWIEIFLDHNLNIRANVTGNHQPAYLSLSPSTGDLQPSNNQYIDAIFNPSGLELGTYNSQITIASNDPNHPYETIDVELIISDPIPILHINPETQDVSIGDIFETNVEIQNIENLGSFELNLNFDPQYLQANLITLGNFLGSTGRQVFPLNNTIDNANGLIEYAITTLGSNPPGPDGSGVLLTIEWTANANLENNVVTDLILQDVQLTEPNGQIITVDTQDAQVNIISCYIHDFDCDCDVDIVDVTMAAYAYGTSVGDPNYSPMFDLDSDGDIDIVDITMVTYDYGWTCGKVSSEIINFDNVNNEDVILGISSINDNYDGTYNIELYIEDIEHLGGYELELDFNPNTMEILSIEQGSLIGSTNRTIHPLKNDIDNKTGRIYYSIATLGSQIDGASRNGVLLKIKCKSLSSNIGALDLISAQLVRIDAQVIDFKFKSNETDINGETYIVSTYPSPFQNNMSIQYNVGQTGKIVFKFYNVYGGLVKTVNTVNAKIGIYNKKIENMGINPGVYFVSMELNGSVIDSKKIIAY